MSNILNLPTKEQYDAQNALLASIVSHIEGLEELKGDKGDKGEKGDTGAQGPQGEKGDKGDTGDAGKSAYQYAQEGGYLETEAKFAEDINPDNIKSELSQIETPKIVSSINEMTDTTKHYINQNTGTIWAYMKHTVTIPAHTVPNFTNVFDADTAMLGYRWSGSSGAPTNDVPQNILSDFIPCDLSEGEHTLRIKNGYVHSPSGSNTNTSIVYYSSNNNSSVLNMTKQTELTPIPEDDDVTAYMLGDKSGSMFSGYQNTQYIRVCFRQGGAVATLDNARNVIITIDEPITYTNIPESTETYYAWTDTDITYTPTFKTDLIGVLGEDNIIYLSDNLPSGTYTLKYGDETYDTIGTIVVE